RPTALICSLLILYVKLAFPRSVPGRAALRSGERRRSRIAERHALRRLQPEALRVDRRVQLDPLHLRADAAGPAPLRRRPQPQAVLLIDPERPAAAEGRAAGARTAGRAQIDGGDGAPGHELAPQPRRLVAGAGLLEHEREVAG